MMNSVGPFNKWIIVVLVLVTIMLCECYHHNDDTLYSLIAQESTWKGSQHTNNIT